MSRSNYLGVWESGRFIGAAVFSLGASPSLGAQYGAAKFEAAELTRIALSRHSAPVSRIVAIAAKMVSRANPGLRFLVSFADPFHGHHGGIYQAGNWVYTGKSGPSIAWQCGSRILDPRRFNGHGHNAARSLPRGAVKIRTPGKHRYVIALKKADRAALSAWAQPYPKRAKPRSEAPAYQAGEGGVIPTRALQIQDARGAA